MKFQRTKKYGQIEFTARKLSMLESGPERKRKALAAKLPLLADLLPIPAPVDVRAVIEERQQRADACEQRTRSLYARVWRESRRDFFAANNAQRAEIRNAWDAWTGPRTCMYYRYVVDLHTGIMAARSERFKRQQDNNRALRAAQRAAQHNLF